MVTKWAYIRWWQHQTKKINFGKTYPPNEFIEKAIEKHQLKLLPISLGEIYYIQTLPLIHRDPFDRIIAGQSLVQNFLLISANEIFDSYNVKRLW